MGSKKIVWNNMIQLDCTKHNSLLYWSRMFHLIDECKHVIFQKQNVKEFASYLLDRILEFNDDDDPRMISYVHRILQLYTLNISGFASEKIKVVKALLRTPVEISYFDPFFSGCTFLEVAMEKRDTKFIRALMRFGISPARLWSYHASFVDTKIGLIRSWQQQTIDMRHRKAETLAMEDEDIMMLKNNHNGVSSRGIGRVMLIISMLYVNLKEKFKSTPSKEYGECINLLFRTIPDPFIRRFEVEACCRFVFRECEMLEELVRTLMRDCDDFYDLENDMPYETRSLKHLSRCAVRRFSMKSAILIPGQVKSLDIPEMLKDYLLCEF